MPVGDGPAHRGVTTLSRHYRGAPRQAPLGLALAVAGLLIAFAGTLPAAYNPLSVCDRTDAPHARLINSQIASFLPATVGCTWIPYASEGAEDESVEPVKEFHERLPVNQTGQLVGAVALGGGLALIGVAVTSRRKRDTAGVKGSKHLP